MIEVLVFSGNEVVARAEAECPESAQLAARTLWDEAWSGLQGQKRAVAFVVDEKVVARVEARP